MSNYLVHGIISTENDTGVYNFGESMKILISDTTKVYTADLTVDSYEDNHLGFTPRTYYTYKVTNLEQVGTIEGNLRFLQDPFTISENERLTADIFRNKFHGFFLNDVQKTFGITMIYEDMPYSMEDPSNFINFGYIRNGELWLLDECAVSCQGASIRSYRGNFGSFTGLFSHDKEIVMYLTIGEYEYNDMLFRDAKKFKDKDFAEKVFEDLEKNPAYGIEDDAILVEIFVKKLGDNNYGIIIAKKPE